MKAFAYDLYRYYPEEYFKYSQSPIIRIQYPYNVIADIMTDRSFDHDFNTVHTEISNNYFSDNLNMQVLTYKSLQYKASILEYDSQMSNSTLGITGNEITRN